MDDLNANFTKETKGSLKPKDLEKLQSEVGYSTIDHAKLINGRVESYAYSCHSI